MVAASLLLVFLIIGAGLLALIVFFIALFQGFFDQPGQQAEIIFDEADLRLWRPWETPSQLADRRHRYGPLLSPTPGEWGGAE